MTAASVAVSHVFATTAVSLVNAFVPASASALGFRSADVPLPAFAEALAGPGFVAQPASLAVAGTSDRLSHFRSLTVLDEQSGEGRSGGSQRALRCCLDVSALMSDR